MGTVYSLWEFFLYLILYSFLGWVVEVAVFAIQSQHFENRGFLNLPLNMPFGITMAILAAALPTLERSLPGCFVMTWVVMMSVRGMADQFVKSVSRRSGITAEPSQKGSKSWRFLLSLIMAVGYLVLCLVLHPFVFALVSIMPRWLVKTVVIVMAVIVALDCLTVRHVLLSDWLDKATGSRKARIQRLGDRITASIWRRLKKAYPGIEEEEAAGPSRYVFAKGICFDKLVWVFLISSFLGALIEMVFCRAVGGTWMNRSSVLYGAFSVVWGFGAVVLTVVLQRLAEKEDRTVFLAGFVIGGAYEYLCSVFTEIVFGTVFWDYSHMPLNIGGRTNVLFCVFWGLLSVVWIKILYPPMGRAIEKCPPLPGKIMTWAIVFLMLCNGVLTAAAMQRYTIRQTWPASENVIEAYLDSHYDDDWMENRWPNMIVTVE